MKDSSQGKLIWIIAGESSGDLYGAKLAAELRVLDPSIRIAGMGSGNMRKAGVELLVDSSELGVVGLIEVLENIVKFIRILLFFRKEALRQRPDAVILIDYPGFNIRFARILWKAAIPVIWYISPQVWAWRKSNIPKLAKYCRKLMVIFPFEPEVWKGSGLDVEFAGHPLVQIVRDRASASISRDPERILLLPGSRKSEISRLVTPFLETVAILHQRHSQLKFTISVPREKTYRDILQLRDEFLQTHPGIVLPELDISWGETARWMQEASCGLAASGTVTVESAIAGLPLVVAYRLNPVTFHLARMFVKLYRGFFTMVNIIRNRHVFEEFLQFQVIPEDLADAVEKIMPGGSRRAFVESEIRAMTEDLSVGASTASHRAAEIVMDVISSGSKTR